MRKALLYVEKLDIKTGMLRQPIEEENLRILEL